MGQTGAVGQFWVSRSSSSNVITLQYIMRDKIMGKTVQRLQSGYKGNLIANSVSIGASDSVGQYQGVQRPILRKRQKDPYEWPEAQRESHEYKKWKIKYKKGDSRERRRDQKDKTSGPADLRRCESWRASAEPDAEGTALRGASPLLVGRER